MTRPTERATEVLNQIAEGLPNAAIAQHLGVSEETVKIHVTSILASCRSRTARRLSCLRGGSG